MILLSTLLLPAFAKDTCETLPEVEKSANSERLKDLVEAMRAQTRIRKDELKWVVKLEKDGLVCTADDAHLASAVLTTSFDPDILRTAYDLAVRAHQERVPQAELQVAIAYDRLLVSQDLGQVFLTQSDTKGGEPCLFAVGEVASDAKRKTHGLGPAAPVFAGILEGNQRVGEPNPAALDQWELWCKPVGSQAKKAKR